MNDRPANFLPAIRRAVEDEIERLIGLLDGMDPDPDLEPWLGVGDDREEDGSDAEPSHGWSDDINQSRLVHIGSSQFDECEPDLGWTDEIDQQRRLQTMPGWKAEDGEPDLGFIGHGTGWTGEAVYDDDREDVCEDEGADIQAQPHDAIDEGNDEPTLGRLETIHQGAASYSGIEDSQGGPLHFNGGGYSIGKKMLKRIGADGFVLTAPALPIAEYREIARTLPDGAVMRSIVPKMDSAPDLNGDWRALHYRAAHEGRAQTWEGK